MKVTILISEYASISRDGKLNIMGMFRQITARKFPAVFQMMYAVAIMEAELGEVVDQVHDASVVLVDADGKELGRMNGKFKFPSRRGNLQPRAQLMLRLPNVAFPAPGAYDFILVVDNQNRASETILLVEHKGQQREEP